MEIVAQVSPAGDVARWESHIVSRLEAMDRWRSGRPIVQRVWGDRRQFLFSLSPGDSVRLEIEPQRPAIYVVNVISGNRIEVTHASDARSKSEIRKLGKEGGRLLLSLEVLRRANAQKVSVSPMGDVVVARD
jgi:hypothetical protein